MSANDTENDNVERPPRTDLVVGGRADLRALYRGLYFASLDSVADLAAADLVEAVLRPESAPPGTNLGPAPARDGSSCVAQFVVSADPPSRFDPELSMREPFELQVWRDGSLAVEIEFMGADIRTDPEAGESLRQVLTQWAHAQGWGLVSVFNDRGRSLPEVWNAAFRMPDLSESVEDAVHFARRAIAVAEAFRYGGRFIEGLLDVLRSGDPAGLIGTPVTAVFQPRPAIGETPSEQFQRALDICAFANSPQGGLLVLGLDSDGERVTGVQTGAAEEGGERRIESALKCLVYPLVESVHVETVRAKLGGNLPPADLIVVHVPPQEQVLKPFMVGGVLVDGQLHQQGATIVERRGASIYCQGLAALHSQSAAGRALLGGAPVPASPDGDS